MVFNFKDELKFREMKCNGITPIVCHCTKLDQVGYLKNLEVFPGDKSTWKIHIMSY